MKLTCHLIVKKSGSVRISKSRPNVKGDEISIAMNLDLPDILFRKPQLQANIVIPEKAVNPKEITVEIADNIREAIEQATGLDVTLEVINAVDA